MTIKPERLKRSMIKKGFAFKEGGNHTKFIFVHTTPGKVPVTTIMSRGGHGKDAIGPALASRMRRELGFDTLEQLERYEECVLTEEEYVDILKANGTLNRRSVRGKGSVLRGRK